MFAALIQMGSEAVAGRKEPGDKMEGDVRAGHIGPGSQKEAVGFHPQEFGRQYT